jgi:hypothetical protein
MKKIQLKPILRLLKRLQEASISYKLAHNQEDAITAEIVVPGQRWEVDFYLDGTIDVEIFKSDGKIRNEDAIDELFRQFAD